MPKFQPNQCSPRLKRAISNTTPAHICATRRKFLSRLKPDWLDELRAAAHQSPSPAAIKAKAVSAAALARPGRKLERAGRPKVQPASTVRPSRNTKPPAIWAHHRAHFGLVAVLIISSKPLRWYCNQQYRTGRAEYLPSEDFRQLILIAVHDKQISPAFGPEDFIHHYRSGLHMRSAWPINLLRLAACQCDKAA